MLTRIGMGRHLYKLINNGWDNINFIKDINNDDLIEAGILCENERNIILDTIYKL